MNKKQGKRVDVEKAIRLYKEGMSINEIGRVLGHHHSVIKYHIIRSDAVIRTQSEAQRKPIESSTIAEMYESGMSAVEIAKEFGITYQCVYDRLAETGIKTRNRREQIAKMMERGTYNVPKGEAHKNWRGGKTNWNGYIGIKVEGKRKYIPEHRHVWEQHHGPLPKDWIVHHLNGIKDDNRIENLVAMPRKMHSPKSITEPFKQRIRELEKLLYDLDKRLKKRA